MKGKLLTLSFAAISVVAILIPLALPSIVFATSNPIKANVFDPTILAGPLTICLGSSTVNPSNSNFPVCSNLCDLVAQVAQVIYYMIAVVIWIVTPILVAVGGIMIMLGGASPEMVGRGKKTITGAVWGVVITLCAWLIVFTFVNAFGNLHKYIGGFGGQICNVSTNGGVYDSNGNYIGE